MKKKYKKIQIDEDTLKKIDFIIREMRNKKIHEKPKTIGKKSNGITKEKRRLIGILPSLLLDKRYFQRNDKIAEFADKELGIKIPSHEKKRRAELMGRIIEEINKQPPEKIYKFSQAFDKILGKEEKEGISDFFIEWNKAMKEL